MTTTFEPERDDGTTPQNSPWDINDAGALLAVKNMEDAGISPLWVNLYTTAKNQLMALEDSDLSIESGELADSLESIESEFGPYSQQEEP